VSYAIDVNVLLYASDSRSRYHGKAVEFLEACAKEPDPLCVAWVTLMSYLRIATHPSIFDHPMTPEQARSNVEALLGLPHCRVLSELDGFWATYRETTEGLTVRGPLVPDAHLAAVLRQHGVLTLWTHDRDFLKFDFLSVYDPFE